ncbi:hypothetical protein KUCAC02_019465 [Chaenocephalus aceratus]|uniref:Uncharacterized protein n=1 Tax=Chaenocephalus aceratus TaxID=36190 RepID=A0ACB9VP87_CHAAC|nr:hypothetical protein KUCAC02_019465 [Chaenocephalus aceratus]
MYCSYIVHARFTQYTLFYFYLNLHYFISYSVPYHILFTCIWTLHIDTTFYFVFYYVCWIVGGAQVIRFSLPFLHCSLCI